MEDRKTLFIHGDFDQKITKHCNFVLHKSRANYYGLRLKYMYKFTSIY